VSLVELSWTVGDAFIDLNGTGATDEQMIAFASIDSVTDAEFRAALGENLNISRPIEQPTAPSGGDAVTFRPGDGSGPTIVWSASTGCMELRTSDTSNSVCVEPNAVSPPSIWADGQGSVSLFGILDGAPRTVIVRDTTTQAEIAQARVFAPDKPVDKRAFVISVDAKRAGATTSFELVALDGTGAQVGNTLSVPSSFADVLQSTANESDGPAHGSSSGPITPGPKLASGTFEDHPWVLYGSGDPKREPRTDGWMMSFAGSAPVAVELNIAPLPPTPGFEIIQSAYTRRRFVVAVVNDKRTHRGRRRNNRCPDSTEHDRLSLNAAVVVHPTRHVYAPNLVLRGQSSGRIGPVGCTSRLSRVQPCERSR
jgi:hypothetical protein